MTNTLSAESLKQTISYYYLVSYCPPERVKLLEELCQPLRSRRAEENGMSAEDYRSVVIPEVCHRILAFHQNNRYPDQSLVDALAEVMFEADSSPAQATVYQAQMAKIAVLPGRAKADNRLHRKKGCSFCQKPCFYGYFTLVSDPQS